MTACGDGGGAPAPATTTTPTPTPAPTVTTTFVGTVAGSSGQSGTLSVVVQAQVAALRPRFFRWPLVATLHAQANTIPATGTLLLIGGGVVALTGSYNLSTGVLTLSGGGFTLTGTFSNGAITGTYTGPGGASGTFAVIPRTGGAFSTVTSYCGTIFRAGPGSAIFGTFNITVNSFTSTLIGTYYLSGDSTPRGGSIRGTVLPGNLFNLIYSDGSNTGRATGTIQDATLSGTSEGGNFLSGSSSSCPALP